MIVGSITPSDTAFKKTDRVSVSEGTMSAALGLAPDAFSCALLSRPEKS